MTDSLQLLDIPSVGSLDDDDHGWKYQAVHDIEKACHIDMDGTTDESPSVRELVARRANQVHYEQRWTLAVDGSGPLGWAYVRLPTHENLDKAEVMVCVHPSSRRQGIGSALLAWCEDTVLGARRTLAFAEVIFGARVDHEPYVETIKGGKVPARTACVEFPMNRGYQLSHADRRSRLDLPVDPGLAAQLMGQTLPYTDGYRLHTWFGGIPDRWMDPFARLKEAFSRDAPMGEVPFDEEVWCSDRVDQMVREILDQGNLLLMTAVECVATGELVGFTEFRWPDDRDAEAASQYFTIVSAGHRGHRLGMWMKLVNAAEIMRLCPGIKRVHTDNAQENIHMLGINAAMGFRPNGGIAEMSKRLD